MSRALAIEPTNQAKDQRTDSPKDNVQEKIKLRAYELYVARGCEDGHHEEDWYRAEKETRHPGAVNRAA